APSLARGGPPPTPRPPASAAVRFRPSPSLAWADRLPRLGLRPRLRFDSAPRHPWLGRTASHASASGLGCGSIPPLAIPGSGGPPPTPRPPASAAGRLRPSPSLARAERPPRPGLEPRLRVDFAPRVHR